MLEYGMSGWPLRSITMKPQWQKATIMIEPYLPWAVAAYLAVGFLIGLYAVKDGRCESPVETWFFMTVAGPLFAGVFLIVLLPIAPFAFLVWLFKIETSQSDTRGV
jgi:hypothetical protein